MFDAVVLAGGGVEPLTVQEKVANKAFIDLNGRPLLAYILESLEQAPSIRRVFVVGPFDELLALQREGHLFTALPEEGGMLDNAATALSKVRQDGLCLLVTGDIPLLSAGIVEQFLALCAPFEADFFYPVISRESCERRFPETRRTYVRLKEGLFTGGNLVLISPSWFARHRSRLENFIKNRKKPLKLLRTLPFIFILKFVFRKLTLADLERCLSKMMHLSARAVPCDLVEIGIDIDKISDLEMVRKLRSP